MTRVVPNRESLPTYRYMQTHAHMHTCTYAYMYICIHVHMHDTCTHRDTDTCMDGCTYNVSLYYIITGDK